MASSGSALALASYAAAERLTGKRAFVAARDDGARLHEETHYGPIVKVLHFGEQVVTCICPLALLWSMASASDEFGMSLVGCLNGALGGFILYIDDVRPGNIQRPGPGRVYYSILWSLAQYPPWYFSRLLGGHHYASCRRTNSTTLTAAYRKPSPP